MNISEIWRRITATRYTRALEAEVARLRTENRALLNSILGIAGVPPITVPSDAAFVGAQHAVPVVATQPKHPGPRRGFAAPGSTGASAAQTAHLRQATSTTMAPENENAKNGNVVPPMRRRSWHQIYRILEINSARKKPQEAVSIPPATTRS